MIIHGRKHMLISPAVKISFLFFYFFSSVKTSQKKHKSDISCNFFMSIACILRREVAGEYETTDPGCS